MYIKSYTICSIINLKVLILQLKTLVNKRGGGLISLPVSSEAKHHWSRTLLTIHFEGSKIYLIVFFLLEI